jgi:hypothetical protein
LKFRQGQSLLSRDRVTALAAWCREAALPAAVFVGIIISWTPAKDTHPIDRVVANEMPSLAADLASTTVQPANQPASTVQPVDSIHPADIEPVKTESVKAEQVKTDSDQIKSAAASSAPAPGTPDAGGSTHTDASTPNQQVMAALEPPVTAALPQRPLDEPAQTDGEKKPVDSINQSIDSVEIVDECLVIEMCVDRYLWGLYERTRKEDSVKEREQRQAAVKRKGKMITIMRMFMTVKDEDFGWKDPEAAQKAGMSIMDYVIGGTDKDFKLRLFQMLRAAEQAGLGPGITSCFRDDYRQSIASGLKAASNRSFHGGSLRGGYGHGMAADIVSVKGATRGERQNNSQILWKWVDDHGSEFGIGRPYLGRDPPHVAPIDGEEFVLKRPRYKPKPSAVATNASQR